MTIDDVIRELAGSENTLPRASMQWALDHWTDAAPALIALVERYASGDDRSESAARAVFLAAHLLGQQAEAAAFPALCRLMRCDMCDEVLGDSITVTLPQIVISTYDGNVEALAAVAEDSAAECFTRYAALLAMSYLTHTGRIAEAQMREYLRRYYAESQPQAESPVWQGWVIAIAALGYADLGGLVEQVFRRGFIPGFVMRVQDFRRELADTLADPTQTVGFKRDNLRPFGDAIETLEKWYCFTDQYKEDQRRQAAREAVDRKYGQPDFPSLAAPFGVPYVNMFRGIGRNEPCLCGSGKKYKKCCLGKKAETASLITMQ